jgi:hypothetical protein
MQQATTWLLVNTKDSVAVLLITNPDPVPDPWSDDTSIDTTTGNTACAIPAIESSARGDVWPLVAGSEIEGAGMFPIMEAPKKPIMPANNPLITPAIIAFLTAGEALAAD